jgi:hypothetical protein
MHRGSGSSEACELNTTDRSTTAHPTLTSRDQQHERPLPLARLRRQHQRLEGRLTGPHPNYEFAPSERWQHKTIHVEPQ